MNQNKTIAMYFVLVVLMLVVGIALGYRMWGMDRSETSDYRATLSKAVEYLANIEKENKALKEKTAELQKEVDVLTKKMKEGPDKLNRQIDTLQQQIASMTVERGEVQSSLEKTLISAGEKEKELTAKIEALTDEIEEVANKKVALQSLVEENKSLRKENEGMQAELREIKQEMEILKKENERLKLNLGDETRVQDLENEVAELRASLEAILQLAVPHTEGTPPVSPAE